MYTFSELRKNAGFTTQVSLAEALHLKGRAVVARWETGENYPRAPLIPIIADKLNCTERELIAAISASKASHKNERGFYQCSNMKQPRKNLKSSTK